MNTPPRVKRPLPRRRQNAAGMSKTRVDFNDVETSLWHVTPIAHQKYVEIGKIHHENNYCGYKVGRILLWPAKLHRFRGHAEVNLKASTFHLLTGQCHIATRKQELSIFPVAAITVSNSNHLAFGKTVACSPFVLVEGSHHVCLWGIKHVRSIEYVHPWLRL